MPENEVKLTKLAKCAGCGAKVGAGVLAQLLDGIRVHQDPNLLVGFDKSDDASVYKVSDDLALVQTVDFFPPIADDPYLFGQIAATNALSDVYAMGGEPRLCLNIMAVPESMPKDAVHQLLRGGYDKVYEAGALITGGHSILDDEPKYGLAVTGFVHPDRVLTNSGARPGDVLLLTKPIGIGVLTTAQKAEMLSPEGQALAERLMTTLNKSARDAMVRYRVHACTDVTGFGLLGHSFEMAQGSDVELELNVDDIDLIPEALAFANMGLLPAGMYRNRTFAEPGVDAGIVELCRQDLLYDPQTAGGLLMAVDPADADALYEELKGSVPSAQRIGVVREYLPEFRQAPALCLYIIYVGMPSYRQRQERGGGPEVDQHRPGVHDGGDKGRGHDGRVHVDLLGGNGQHAAHQLGQDHRGHQGQGDHQGDGGVVVLEKDPQAVGGGQDGADDESHRQLLAHHTPHGGGSPPGPGHGSPAWRSGSRSCRRCPSAWAERPPAVARRRWRPRTG